MVALLRILVLLYRGRLHSGFLTCYDRLDFHWESALSVKPGYYFLDLSMPMFYEFCFLFNANSWFIRLSYILPWIVGYEVFQETLWKFHTLREGGISWIQWTCYGKVIRSTDFGMTKRLNSCGVDGKEDIESTRRLVDIVRDSRQTVIYSG